MFSLHQLDGEVLSNIGIQIKALRKANRLTQSDLAERIGVSRKHISDIENGHGTSLLIFVKLLKVFNRVNPLLDLLQAPSISAKDQFNRSAK